MGWITTRALNLDPICCELPVVLGRTHARALCGAESGEVTLGYAGGGLQELAEHRCSRTGRRAAGREAQGEVCRHCSHARSRSGKDCAKRAGSMSRAGVLSSCSAADQGCTDFQSSRSPGGLVHH